jgi:hypothetical protein
MGGCGGVPSLASGAAKRQPGRNTPTAWKTPLHILLARRKTIATGAAPGRAGSPCGLGGCSRPIRTAGKSWLNDDDDSAPGRRHQAVSPLACLLRSTGQGSPHAPRPPPHAPELRMEILQWDRGGTTCLTSTRHTRQLRRGSDIHDGESTPSEFPSSRGDDVHDCESTPSDFM